jgi:hypothetical protein
MRARGQRARITIVSRRGERLQRSSRAQARLTPEKGLGRERRVGQLSEALQLGQRPPARLDRRLQLVRQRPAKCRRACV